MMIKSIINIPNCVGIIKGEIFLNVKNNQRFRETEIRMQSAMLELMKNVEFDKITVKKICEKAKVNRSTFYAHFIDIYDMLDKMEVELRRELLDSYSSGSKEEYQIFSEKSFIRFLSHIKKHKYFYKINLQTRNKFPLKQGYEQLSAIIQSLCENAGITSNNEIMYYFVCFQAGFTMILKRWVDMDCKETEEELTKIIEGCIPAILLHDK